MNQKREKINSNPVGVAPLDDQNSKGITLIALIITIIIMLILVGVTVAVAINGGLFKTAKDATISTQNKRDEELNASTGRVRIGDVWYDSLEDYTNGKKSENQGSTVTYGGVTLQIGDYVDYTPDQSTYEKSKLSEDYTGSTSNDEDLITETDLKWRVLGVDQNGNLTLISDRSTNKDVDFKGAKGYNNGVYILNDICKTLYSNKDLGVTARSLTIEDVEAGYSEEGIKARNEYNKDNSHGTQYGKSMNYGNYLKFPALYAQENGSGVDSADIKTEGIGRSDPFYTEDQLTNRNSEIETASSVLYCTQTSYSFNSPKDCCSNDKFYSLVFEAGNYYWLASRDCSANPDFAMFLLAGISKWGIGGRIMYGEGNFGSISSLYYLRPAISLNSNYVVTLCEGENSETNMHTLSKAN